MKNIFENAKFGDIFRTRDGRKAIYNGHLTDRHWLIVERHPWNVIGFNSCGKPFGLEEDIDIVSKWQEPINEKELTQLALEYHNKQWATNYKSLDEITDDLDLQAVDDFIAGCRAAKES